MSEVMDMMSTKKAKGGRAGQVAVQVGGQWITADNLHAANRGRSLYDHDDHGGQSARGRFL